MDDIDNIINEQEKKFDSVLNDFEDKFIEKYSEEKIDGDLAETDIDRILNEIGFFAVISALLNETYEKIIDIADNTFTETVSFTAEQLEELTAIKSMDLKKIMTITDDMKNKLASNIFEYGNGNLTKTQLFEKMREIMAGIKDRYISVWVDTGISGFYRRSSVMLAKEAGYENFKYVGPIDRKNRPFCAEHINEIKTLEEWDEYNDDPLMKGQPSPVSVFLGGYRCRHSLEAV